MARDRFSQLPIERQKAILDIAGEAFAQTGFEKTSYNKLLEKMGLGKSSAYYYFENKRDLFLTLLIDCYADYFAQMQELALPTNADAYWDYVTEITDRAFRFMEENPRASQLIQCIQDSPGLLSEVSDNELLNSLESRYDTIIELGHSLSAIRCDIPHSIVIKSIQAISHAIDQWYIKNRDEALAIGSATLAGYYTSLVRGMLEAR